MSLELQLQLQADAKQVTHFRALRRSESDLLLMICYSVEAGRSLGLNGLTSMSHAAYADLSIKNNLHTILKRDSLFVPRK